MAERRRVAVLISGRGSNLGALIAHCAAPTSCAAITLVVSDRPDAAGLERARAAGIATAVVDRRALADRATFEHDVELALSRHDVELVCLAGFMRVLSPAFVARRRDRILNVHPSLLPAFRGLDTHRRALDAGVRFHGCTVHVVRAELDAGPIVVQGVVPVHPGDTEESLGARVLAVEHRCYPWALELVASGRARIENERVVVDADAPETVLINPLKFR